MRDRDIEFTQRLESLGKTWEYRPFKFRMWRHNFIPDIYCPDENRFYKIINSERSFNCVKMQAWEFMYLYPNLELKIVYSNGQEHNASLTIPERRKQEILRTEIRRACVERDLKIRCYNCMRYLDPYRVVIHHEIPVALGGELSPDNFTLLCFDCHGMTIRKKYRAKILEDFFRKEKS